MPIKETLSQFTGSVQPYLDNPMLLLPYLVKLLTGLALFWFGRRIIRLIEGLTCRALAKAGADETLIRFLRNVIHYLLLIVLWVMILSLFGFQTTSLLTLLGAAGLSIGLALKNSLSNIASGVLIILLRPFRVNDVVEVAGQTGTVENIDIFTTSLRTADNRLIIVPNGDITSNPLINYSAKPIRRVDLPIGVSYEDDLKKAREIMLATVSAHPQVLEDPAPSILLTDLGDSSVNFSVRPWCHTADYWTVRSDLLEKLKVNLEAAGCSIPYPQRDVHLYPQDSAS